MTLSAIFKSLLIMEMFSEFLLRTKHCSRNAGVSESMRSVFSWYLLSDEGKLAVNQ